MQELAISRSFLPYLSYERPLKYEVAYRLSQSPAQLCTKECRNPQLYCRTVRLFFCSPSVFESLVGSNVTLVEVFWGRGLLAKSGSNVLASRRLMLSQLGESQAPRTTDCTLVAELSP